MTHRINLDLGIAYMSSLTPLIEAIEQAGLASLNKDDAERVASSPLPGRIHVNASGPQSNRLA